MADLKIGIRKATRYDITALEVMMSKGVEESQGFLPDYDPHLFWHEAVRLIQGETVWVAAQVDIANKREKLIGCLALDAHKWRWNPRVILLESVHFYVLPEARALTLADGKTFVAEALISAAKELADTVPVPLRIENLHQLGPDNRAEAKDRFFDRAGFIYAGGSHVYMPKVTASAAAEAA